MPCKEKIALGILVPFWDHVTMGWRMGKGWLRDKDSVLVAYDMGKGLD